MSKKILQTSLTYVKKVRGSRHAEDAADAPRPLAYLLPAPWK